MGIKNRLRALLTVALAIVVLTLFVVPTVVMAETLAPAPASSLSSADLQALVGVGGVPVVLAFVAVAKRYVEDDRTYPLMALVFGVLWNMLLAVVLQPPLPLGPALLAGLLCGLTAAGTFSAVKTVRKPRPELTS